jgi:hypothetical protein
MVLPGHIGGGFLTTTFLLRITHAGMIMSSPEILTLTIIGTLAGDFPDIDLLRFYFDQKKSSTNKVNDHRDYITHAPLFWLILCTLISGVGLIFNSLFIIYLGIVILGGSWTHLILDSIEYGVAWLWPYSRRHFSLFKNKPSNTMTARPGTMLSHWQFIKGMYLKTWTFWAELLVTLVAIIIFFSNNQ